jgi:hypothetical protein
MGLRINTNLASMQAHRHLAVTAIRAVHEAIGGVSTARADLGAVQNRFELTLARITRDEPSTRSTTDGSGYALIGGPDRRPDARTPPHGRSGAPQRVNRTEKEDRFASSPRRPTP